jgi:hypothetical protein
MKNTGKSEKSHPDPFFHLTFDFSERCYTDGTILAPDFILDDLPADGKIQPRIVVTPSGRAQTNDRAGDLNPRSPGMVDYSSMDSRHLAAYHR